MEPQVSFTNKVITLVKAYAMTKDMWNSQELKRKRTERSGWCQAKREFRLSRGREGKTQKGMGPYKRSSVAR